jgi:hypothetical protein
MAILPLEVIGGDMALGPIGNSDGPTSTRLCHLFA